MVFLVLAVLYCVPAHAQDLQFLERKALIVFFDPRLRSAAEETVMIYPEIRSALEKDFGWGLNIRPSVFLMADTKQFHQMAPHPMTVAFAVPAKHWVVMDYSKISSHPFSLETTLKHEMCHLLLDEHIKEPLLPRWLNEGVCQWASDWIGDITWSQKQSVLNKAAIKGTFIPLSLLRHQFPADPEALQLAYEQSKGFVAYMLGEFGRAGLLKILAFMKQGESVESAVQLACSKSLESLEQDWHRSLREDSPWLIHVSVYLYEIVFGLTALISIYGFIRLIMKKRSYRDEDSDESLLP